MPDKSFEEFPMNFPHMNMRLILLNMLVKEARRDKDDRWEDHPLDNMRALNDMRGKYLTKARELTGIAQPPSMFVQLRSAHLGGSAPGPSSSKDIDIPRDMMFVTGTELSIKETDRLFLDAEYEMEAHCTCRNCTKGFTQVGWPIVLQCPNCEVSGIFVNHARLYRIK
ncbi:MAG: hypothetical protein ACXABY_16995 [Candidatus Thorarchaeota archaeon]|jgi:hypothetical protein